MSNEDDDDDGGGGGGDGTSNGVSVHKEKIKPLDHARHMGHAWVRMKKIKTCHSSLSHLGYAENLFQMRPQLIELLSNDAICMCIAVQARPIVKIF